jgi:hypothetical protein
MQKFCFLIMGIVSIIGIYYLETQGQAAPLSACDRRYAMSMQGMLQLFKTTMSEDALKLAQNYMVMLKQQQDLQFAIGNLELKTFDTGVAGQLRIPLTRYSKCVDILLTTDQMFPVNSNNACNTRYQMDMDATLAGLSHTLSPPIFKLAQNYIIMVKQYQDLDFQIKALERTTFDTPTVAQLRTPLARYGNCLTMLRTTEPNSIPALTLLR